MEAYTGGISTRKVDALVEALGSSIGISKSEVSRICQGLDEQVKTFLSRPLDHARFPHVYHDATYLHGRLGRNLQVVSRAVVVAIGINTSATAMCSASPWATARPMASGASSWAASRTAG